MEYLKQNLLLKKKSLKNRHLKQDTKMSHNIYPAFIIKKFGKL